jgi:hypothetical protein
MVDHSCCSFYRTETECLENDPFQMTTFLAPEQLTDEPDPGPGYSADDIFAAGKEFDDDTFGYYRRENYVDRIVEICADDEEWGVCLLEVRMVLLM